MIFARCIIQNMQTPDIIFLNGTSSSGKTTLAKSLQHQLEDIYLHVPVDAFGVMFPESKLGNLELCATATPKLVEGFYRSVSALVSCGNKVIVDTVVQRHHVQVFKPLFENFEVIYVAVKCPIEELKRRELARGDRTVGLSQSQFPEIHNFLRYDVEVDTHENSAEECAAFIRQLLTL